MRRAISKFRLETKMRKHNFAMKGRKRNKSLNKGSFRGKGIPRGKSKFLRQKVG